DHQFYVKQSKCVFGDVTLEYLGNIIFGKGVKMDPKKVAAVRDWHVPTNQRQFTSKTRIQVGELENTFFDDLKARNSCAPILGLPNFDEMFVVETDTSDVGIGVLRNSCNKLSKTPLQQKYVRKLMCFDFVIEYKSGVSNQVVDALSRMYEEEEDVMAAFMTMSQPLSGFISDLQQENETIDELQQLHQKLDRNEPMEGFWREQGMIVFRDHYHIGIESKLKELLLSEFHNTPTTGHSDVKNMLVGLSALFYWKGMRKSTEELIVIFVVVDRFNKSAYFGPLPASFNASKVADVFIDMVVKLYGFPNIIVSDCDPIFVIKF
nr:Ty3/gypsy retrotransposon protein [Tanacetum cinerariifolium]